MVRAASVSRWLLIACLLALPASADARVRSSYCSPSGDYCTSAKKKRNGDVALRIGTFSFTGRYKLCVRAPDKTLRCKRFRLRKTKLDIYEGRVSWRKHFPSKGAGLYKVSWHKFGGRLGPRLGFRR